MSDIKEKFKITFYVEMTEKDAKKCADMMFDYRHGLNEKRKWDVSIDFPSYMVERE